HIQAGVGRNSRQPSFQRAAAGKAFQLRKGFQECFLRGFFGLAAIPKKSMSDMENPGTESSHNFGERTFILSPRLARQFEFGGLFVTVRQKRSLRSAPAERSPYLLGTALWMNHFPCDSAVDQPTWSAF
ncbi:MAG TPA: hypothetical protein VE961_17135, partial [Pyrinomonadaceae bacterium]|nr:hypothetical protein [Pyrinomonadaceae bacterium]